MSNHERQGRVRLGTIIHYAKENGFVPHKDYRLNDVGNSERFADANRDKLLWVGKWKCWMAFNGKFWERDVSASKAKVAAMQISKSLYNEASKSDDKDQSKLIANWAKQSSDAARIKSMLYLAQSHMTADPTEFDKDGYLFNVENGTIDLRTGKLLPHDPKNLISKISMILYNPSAEAPRFLNFLKSIFAGSEQLQTYVQRAFGYSLTTSQDSQLFFICHGTGQNGKGTLMKVLQRVAGDYAQESAPEVLLATRQRSNTNDIARLHGARFVTCQETNDGRRIDEALVKRLTGSDRITARFLNQEFFEFEPTHTLWLITNHLPDIKGTDYSIWRRVRKIHCDVQGQREE